MEGKPFARALTMAAAIAAAMSGAAAVQGSVSRQAILSNIGPYQSRGKGRGKAFDKQRHGNRSGKTYAMNGAREVARRQRQIAAGKLQVAA